jgi:hypothetical protein
MVAVVRRGFRFSADATPRAATYQCGACGKIGAPGAMEGWRACKLSAAYRDIDANDGVNTMPLCSAACESHAMNHGWLKPPPAKPRSAKEQLDDLFAGSAPYAAADGERYAHLAAKPARPSRKIPDRRRAR